MKRSDNDFQKFYYTKVGLGEGCGCAERVIDMHEAERKAGSRVAIPLKQPISLRRKWRRFLNAAGLTRRA